MKRLFAYAAATCIAGGLALSAFADPYVETDGSQAVNTKYFVTPKTRVEVDYAMQDLQTQQQRIFGCNGNAVCQHYINGSRGYSFALKDSSGDWLTVRPDDVQKTPVDRRIRRRAFPGRHGAAQRDLFAPDGPFQIMQTPGFRGCRT